MTFVSPFNVMDRARICNSTIVHWFSSPPEEISDTNNDLSAIRVIATMLLISVLFEFQGEKSKIRLVRMILL